MGRPKYRLVSAHARIANAPTAKTAFARRANAGNLRLRAVAVARRSPERVVAMATAGEGAATARAIRPDEFLCPIYVHTMTLE